MAAAFSNGYVTIYEVTNTLELKDWQLKVEFQNVLGSVSLSGKVSCSSASICWNPSTCQTEGSSFIVGFRSDSPQLNSSKVWEFDQLHQRWLPVAELALPADKGNPVLGVAWAPSIGRPFGLISVATQKGIAIWHFGLTAELDGRLSAERVALLSAHEGEEGISHISCELNLIVILQESMGLAARHLPIFCWNDLTEHRQ